MVQKPTIIFVCEHGAAKSILAAAYFNQFAAESRLSLRAVARGTNPEREIAPQVIQGLTMDGLAATESLPQELSEEDIKYAQRVIAFCDLPEAHRYTIPVDYWRDIPPVTQDYIRARDFINEHIRRLLNRIGEFH